MVMSGRDDTNARLAQLEQGLQRLVAGDLSRALPVSPAGDRVDVIAGGINQLMERVAGSVVKRAELSARAGAIFDGLMELMRANFEHRLPVDDPDDELDAINYAINATAEQLEHTTRELRHHAAIFASVTNAIVVTDLDLRVTVWNRAAEQLYGYSAAEARGQRVPSLLRTQYPVGDTAEQIAKVFFEEGGWEGEVIHISKIGERIPVHGRLVLRRDEQGAPLEVIGVITDLRSVKAAERKLVQSEKLASLGQLGAGIAHELNQPLQAIELLADMIDADDEVRAHKELVGRIRIATKRMGAIVDNVRRFARESTSEKQPTSARAPLTDAISLMLQQLKLSGIVLEQQLASSLPNLLADATQLQQVFANLLINARAALAANETTRPIIRVSAHREGQHVVYRVEDNGDGVPDSVAANMFDPFFTTRDVGEGTGLGLSLSLGIVEEHRGTLEYRSSDLGGACFEVRLPIDDGAGEKAQVQRLIYPAVLAPMQVLVVDDDAMVRDTLSELLNRRGHEVRVAEGVAEAQQSLRDFPCPLVIADYLMATKTGLDLARWIRAEVPATRMILITGYAEQAVIRAAAEAGVACVLPKPFVMADLETAIEAALAP